MRGMIEVDATDDRLAVVDAAKNEVVIGTEGWGSTATAPRLDRRVDEAVSGATLALEFPDSAVTIERPGDARWTTFSDVSGPLRLPDAAHVIQVESNVGIYVAFTGAGRLSRAAQDGPVRLEFDRRTAVTLGFRSLVTRPRHTITVPRTVEGAASAVRYLSAAIDTDSADKSYPTLRVHPPAVAFGDDLDIPEGVFHDVSFSDVTVRLPHAVESLLVAAPLVYYLQADVSLVDAGPVELDAPALASPVRLGEADRFESAVADLLHRVFYLDCLVRNAGPYGALLEELELAETLALDSESLYEAPTAERLRAYLALEYDRIRSDLPAWHLSTVVEPTLANVRALPYLLDRLSLVQRPRPVPVERESLISESVGAAYDPPGRAWDVASGYDLVRNETRLGRVQGWLAEGTPVDAFRATLQAFESRFEYHEQSDGPRSVLVVINDDAMGEERDAVEAIYRERAEELSIDVTVEESLTREQFADRLQTPIDFLHFVGHCDEHGLRCADGSLSATELDRSRVQTFFLNACGSFDEGLALVERGSVAGAVTLHNVLNPQATKVGTTFARLVMHGFSVGKHWNTHENGL